MTCRPLVLHLNGAPGVGKSTLATLWADRHPGTLLLDIDALRTWVSGWRDDFASTGTAVRPAAVALLAAYVANGGSVVLPQLLAERAELDRFRSAALDAGGRWVEVLIEADDITARFGSRAIDRPHLEAVHRLVDDAPADHLMQYVVRLRALVDTVPGAARLGTTEGDVETAYATLVDAVRDTTMPDD